MKMYCYNCDREVDVKTKEKVNSYTIHNIKFEVKEKVHYCINCNNELIDETLDNDLSNIYNEYLKLFGLSFDILKKIRNNLNLSQELFAKALNWSKKSVTRYENKQSLPQVEYLKIYQKIFNNKTEFISILRENRMFLTDKEYYSILNKVNTDISAKDINFILYLLHDNHLTSTQIMKNAFAVDFYSYKKNNKGISNFKYAHANFGPVIDNHDELLNLLLRDNYLKIIDVGDKNIFVPCTECDKNLFTNDELKIIDEVKNKFKDKSANELTNWSHSFKGWKETKNGKLIDFKYAKYLDFSFNN